jgi:2-C-methyl-D-erythritol 4-phosphate cytidylyltransferase
MIQTTPDRALLWSVQTPQVFEFDLIWQSYQKITGTKQKFSDDCGVAEHAGYQVKMIMGNYENFKITTPEDLALAELVIRGRNNANRAGN